MEGYDFFMMMETIISALLLSLKGKMEVTFAGWEHRLKSLESIHEKIYVRHAVSSIYELKDVIRYTAVCDEEHFGSHVNRCLCILAENNFNIKEVKNYWLNDANPYNGVNVATEILGVAVEIQFHTHDSIRIQKEENHPLYERKRVLEVSSRREDLIELQIVLEKLWDIAHKQRVPEEVSLIHG